jgi:hypothetical protein
MVQKLGENRIEIDLLPVSRHDETNATTGDITETDMEAAEVIANYEKHAVRCLGVFNYGQEFGGEAEG